MARQVMPSQLQPDTWLYSQSTGSAAAVLVGHWGPSQKPVCWAVLHAVAEHQDETVYQEKNASCSISCSSTVNKPFLRGGVMSTGQDQVVSHPDSYWL